MKKVSLFFVFISSLLFGYSDIGYSENDGKAPQADDCIQVKVFFGFCDHCATLEPKEGIEINCINSTLWCSSMNCS